MEMKQGLFQTQQLGLNMTQELQQAIQLLQFNTMDLIQFMENIALENPLIDLEVNYLQLADSSTMKQKSFQNSTLSLDQFAPSTTQSIYDYVNSQIISLNLSRTEENFLRFLAQSLDEAGYLTISVEEACNIMGVSTEVGQRVLQMLQNLEPPGIGARTVQECILLQLKRLYPQETEAITIVEKYFHDFVNKKWHKIAATLHINIASIQHVFDFIQKLNPRPGSVVSSDGNEHYFIPDIIIHYEKGKWHIRFKEEDMIDYRFNEDYYKKLQTGHFDLYNYTKKHFNQYRWLQKSIEQRRNTMKATIHAIITKQASFFLSKKNYLQPMTMKEIAEDIEVHESTISRVVKNKYIKAPSGTFLLKDLFTNSISTDNSNGVSVTEMKAKIEKLINNENKYMPLSDQDLTKLLKEEGIKISRRTVAKYRDELHIPTSAKRKRYD
ncbi:RNA polymerase factor sigma-54 [Bacillus kwashiorkori]|uniref:RNA polymerase factor sigma-54 n=1 Tax=Bacillus kwashiorkori TaxID=1522318 RepID=UPI000781C613|nr:RNA polymerase factor sigma-54 [Bacillus kwashiorkori]